MNILRIIDDFMFDRIFQPIVNRFPDAGPAGVARFLLTGDILVHGSVAVMGEHYIFLAVGLIIAGILYAFAGFQKVRLGMRNPRRIEDWPVRAFSWFGFFISFVWTPSDTPVKYGLEIADSVLFLSFWYAVACDKLPPARTVSVWDRLRVVA